MRYLAMFVIVLMPGCSFHIKNIPDSTEFRKPIPQILSEYPEMNKVFKSSSESSEMGMAFVEPFVEKWGEPKSKKLSWWNLWPGNWPFFPQELWNWQLGDKEIQCRIDHPIYEGFSKTVCNCLELVD